jgi:MFS family permease
MLPFLERVLPLAPFRSRGYRYLWFGQLVSVAGTAITTTIVPVQVAYLTHFNALAVGLIGLVAAGPMILLSPVGGALVDAFDRKLLLTLSVLLRTGASGALALNALLPHPSLPVLYGALLVSALGTTVDFPARSAIVPNLVPRRDLPLAIAANNVLFNTGSIGGPAIAGLLLLGHLPFTAAYALDVLSFLAVLVAIALMGPIPGGLERRSFGLDSVLEGASFVLRQPVILSTMALDFVANLFCSPRVLYPFFVVLIYRVNPAAVGVLMLASPLGSLAAGLVSGVLRRVRRPGIAVAAAVAAFGLSTSAFGLVRGPLALAVLALALAGLADTVSVILRLTIIQLAVSDTLRGRVSAINAVFVIGGPQLGQFEAGLAASWFGPQLGVALGGLVAALAAGAMLAAVPSLRRFSVDHMPTEAVPAVSAAGVEAAGDPALAGPKL